MKTDITQGSEITIMFIPASPTDTRRQGNRQGVQWWLAQLNLDMRNSRTLSTSRWTSKVQGMVSTRQHLHDRWYLSWALYRLSQNQWEGTSPEAAEETFRHTSHLFLSHEGLVGAPALNPGRVLWGLLLHFPDQSPVHILQFQETMTGCFSDSKAWPTFVETGLRFWMAQGQLLRPFSSKGTTTASAKLSILRCRMLSFNE